MICHFLLLEAPIRSCKQFEDSPAMLKERFVYNTGKNEIPRSVGVFPGFYCLPKQISLARATVRSSCLAAAAEFPGKC